ncbi:hypothetical protein CNYM01_01530 [Colletotrichum nymphaeae SA-01]|uniref:Uncharacterized protein n=1 Tax=Colletotrichum nymphaeae SA-01 TaxID=1460502 RepID=A0A135TNA0_9PEZI|nr:hypothetical protein CNYM01_01530 [Colletotrichum nymphaeae SA-01]
MSNVCSSPPASAQTPVSTGFTFDRTYPAALTLGSNSEATYISSHGACPHDLCCHALHHGPLGACSHGTNDGLSRSSSYSGSTWPVAGPSLLEDRFPDLDLSSVPYSIDNLSAHTSQLDFQAVDAFEWNNLHAPQQSLADLHITDNTLSTAQCPGVTPFRQSNDTGLVSLGIPDDQSVHALGSFDFSIGSKFDNSISVFLSDSASPQGPLPHKQGAQPDAADWGSQAPLTRTGSIKRSRDESDSDDSSTSGDCPFCENFSGDAKQLSTESISGATSGSMSARCPNVLCGSAPQGIYRDMTGLRIARKHSNATSVKRPFVAVVKTT